jgi:peptide/nickel transport system ATP-binding protein
MPEPPRVQVSDLVVEISATGTPVVTGVSFGLAAGQVLGLVGESGCGKTTLALALLGHARRGLRIGGGSVTIGGTNLLGLRRPELERLRGRLVSYVPQDPASALNPGRRVGMQLREMLTVHQPDLPAPEVQARLLGVLADVGLSQGESLLSRFPHQLSGGQQQRIAIAMALVNRPALIVMDEPTTGLDVTTQAHVLDTVAEVCRTQSAAVVYVSHDLAVISSLADDVAVMYAGRMAEAGPASVVLRHPSHPYVTGLLRAVPDPGKHNRLSGIPGQAPEPAARPAGCAFASRCPLAIDICRAVDPPPVAGAGGHLSWCHRAGEARMTSADDAEVTAVRGRQSNGPEPLLTVSDLNASYGGTPVLEDVSLRIERGRCLAVVGESGSGKTTLARSIAGLHPEHGGTVKLNGQVLGRGAAQRTDRQRLAVQYVFQNPYGSLNPRRNIRRILEQPLRHLPPGSQRDPLTRVLDRVSLSPSVLERYPHQLSGGQRQRVAIARALIVEPELLVCDEVTSALDVSVQAVIMRLLDDLRQEGLAMLFVTHNLGLIRSIAQDVAVMASGKIVEYGAAPDVLAQPSSPEAAALLAALPRLETGGAKGVDGRHPDATASPQSD